MLFGCNKSEQKGEGLTYSINLDKQLEKEIPFSQLFDEVQIIPLETNRECMIQKIKKFEISNNKIFALDTKQKAILIFDAQGKFIKKIQNVGKGPEEYIAVTDFNINRNLQQIELLSPQGAIITYDLDGNFLKRHNLKLKGKVVHYFTNISEDIVCFYSLFSEKKISIYSKSKNKILYETLEKPSEIEDTILLSSGFSPFFNNGETSFYFDQLDRQILKPTNDGLVKVGCIDFGKQNFYYKHKLLDGSISEKNNRLKELSSKFVIAFLYYLENDSFIATTFGFKGKYAHLIINKETKTETVFHSFKDNIRFPFIPIKLGQNTLITTIEPSMLFHYIPREDSIIKCDIKLEDIKINDNPVLVKYKFKNNAEK